MSGLLIWSLTRSLNDCCTTVTHLLPEGVWEIMSTPTLIGIEVWLWDVFPERGEMLLALLHKRGTWKLRRGKVWLQVLGHSSSRTGFTFPALTSLPRRMRGAWWDLKSCQCSKEGLSHKRCNLCRRGRHQSLSVISNLANNLNLLF